MQNPCATEKQMNGAWDSILMHMFSGTEQNGRVELEVGGGNT